MPFHSLQHLGDFPGGFPSHYWPDMSLLDLVVLTGSQQEAEYLQERKALSIVRTILVEVWSGMQETWNQFLALVCPGTGHFVSVPEFPLCKMRIILPLPHPLFPLSI